MHKKIVDSRDRVVRVVSNDGTISLITNDLPFGEIKSIVLTDNEARKLLRVLSFILTQELGLTQGEQKVSRKK
jgi:hypothetical protein